MFRFFARIFQTPVTQKRIFTKMSDLNQLEIELKANPKSDQLSDAVYKATYECKNLIFQYCRNDRNKINLPYEGGYLFTDAVGLGNEELVRFMLDYPVDLTKVTTVAADKKGAAQSFTALDVAVKNKNWKMVEIIVSDKQKYVPRDLQKYLAPCIAVNNNVNASETQKKAAKEWAMHVSQMMMSHIKHITVDLRALSRSSSSDSNPSQEAKSASSSSEPSRGRLNNY